MRRSSVKEYTDTMKRRNTGASRTEKGALLDEYVKVTQTRVGWNCAHLRLHRGVESAQEDSAT